MVAVKEHLAFCNVSFDEIESLVNKTALKSGWLKGKARFVMRTVRRESNPGTPF